VGVEEHGFQAEVEQLLQLMIHSVYSNREVFLRELLSNAADALDKARFVGLTEQDLLPAGGDDPGIRLWVDVEARTVVIEDDGIGMSRAEAIDNLGTIAKSGTKAFLQAAQEGQGDLPGLIGQFGVGFYAVFMVADEVVVESMSARPGEGGVRWSSQGAGSYTVEDHVADHRGTRITITLREDAAEYADEGALRRVVKEHSNYLPWPIMLVNPASTDEDGEEVEASQERINSGKAIWARSPSEVTDEEANEFYRMLSFDFEEPLLRVHLKVDTPLQYSAMLFIPRSRPYDLYMPQADRGPRLYARRVLIEEHASDLLPDWLRFVKGVVDSEDIQLNVSREMVQQTPVVRTIRDALIKRILKELGRIAKAEAGSDQAERYATFWRAFGMLIKEGYWHDHARYGDRILPLLRFGHTGGDADALVSLADYKAAMSEGQDTIWFLTAPSREAALASPHLEAFTKKGWDVLLLTDPVDEWLVQTLTEFDGVALKSVSRGDLDLDEDGDEDGADKADVKGLAPWMAGVLGEAVAGVRASSRLTDSPAVLVDDEQGVSTNMERILRQANQEVPQARRWLEINPKHPLVRDLATLQSKGAEGPAKQLTQLLYDGAQLMDGTAEDTAAIGRRLAAMLTEAAGREVAASDT